MNQNEKRASKARKIKVAYDRTFNTPEGREVLIDLMNTVGIDSVGLDLRNPNGLTLAFNEGAKMVVYRIIRQLNMDTEAYLKLMEERQLAQEDYLNE